jgi:hypothetical protein
VTKKFSIFLSGIVFGALVLAAAITPIGSQPPPLAKVINGNPPLPVVQVNAAQPRKRPRGRKVDPVKVAERHAKAKLRHDGRMGQLPKCTLTEFDCRTAFSCVLPVDDQGQCGDCYGVSSADGCSMALVFAGVLKGGPIEANRLSSQYGLDNSQAFQGGCNGGDEGQVIDFIKTNGFPLTVDYGPYAGSPGSLKPVDPSKLLKIKDWGYCTPNQQQGVASDQDMMNAMVRYGPLSVAFDAGGCDGYQWPQVMAQNGNNVDHAVLCIGWKTENGKVIWLGMNQWGNWGGPGGTFWIQSGAYSWGTEAIWITAGSAPQPIPPGPIPPVPPLGLPSLTVSGALPAGTYQLAPQGAEFVNAGDKAKLQQAADLLNQVFSQNKGKCYNQGGCTCGCVENGKCKCKDCNNPQQKQASVPSAPCCQPPMVPQVTAPMQKMP